MQLVELPLAAVRGWPWPSRIVELIGLTETADATYRCSALFDREKAAVCSATPVSTIDGAPRIGIVGHLVGERGR
jgi:hypothetical protein